MIDYTKYKIYINIYELQLNQIFFVETLTVRKYLNHSYSDAAGTRVSLDKNSHTSSGII
jgi:hypothetical protein